MVHNCGFEYRKTCGKRSGGATHKMRVMLKDGIVLWSLVSSHLTSLGLRVQSEQGMYSRCVDFTCLDGTEMEFEDRRKRGKKSKGAKRKTRAMLEAERRGPLTFASLLEEAASSGTIALWLQVADSKWPIVSAPCNMAGP